MRRLSVICVLFGLAGCVTPSIPIPPPDPARMNFMVQTIDQVSIAVMNYPPDDNYKGGVVYVYNRAQGVGVIQEVKPDGSIGPTPAVRANLGDNLVISIENGDQTVSTCIVLKDGTQDPNTYCTQ